MSFRCVPLLAICLSLLSPAHGKDKPKVLLPDFLLKAETVYVAIDPDAGEPVSNPSANSTARNDVEIALQKWGRFRLTNDMLNADLIISIRKGQKPTEGGVIKGGPVDDRPVIIQPQGGDVRIGIERGTPPGRRGSNSGPHMGTQVAPQEDMFEVYQGKMDSPLDSSPVWRYAAKDGLRPPTVPAIERFRTAIAEAEKQKKP